MAATIPVAIDERGGSKEEESHGIVYWTPASRQARLKLMRLNLSQLFFLGRQKHACPKYFWI